MTLSRHARQMTARRGGALGIIGSNTALRRLPGDVLVLRCLPTEWRQDGVRESGVRVASLCACVHACVRAVPSCGLVA